jgi:hypothetical protein
MSQLGKYYPTLYYPNLKGAIACEYGLSYIKTSWDFDKKTTTPDDLISLVSWLHSSHDTQL